MPVEASQGRDMQLPFQDVIAAPDLASDMADPKRHLFFAVLPLYLEMPFRLSRYLHIFYVQIQMRSLRFQAEIVGPLLYTELTSRSSAPSSLPPGPMASAIFLVIVTLLVTSVTI